MDRMLFSKELEVYREVDVLVVGAGPAGIAAAVCAARSGARTLVFDQCGSVGGMATNGMVGPFMRTFDAKGERQIVLGVFAELVERMSAEGGAIPPSEVLPETSYSGYYRIGHDHVGPFDLESFKRAATAMLTESGAELLLHTCFSDVIMDGDRIAGVVISNKSGMSVIRAAQVIDCTGDGDVAVAAGNPYRLGDENGQMQAATLFFRVCNVDTARLDAHIREHRDEIRPFYGPFSWLIREKREEWGIPRGEVCLFEGPGKGEYRMNVSRILNVDGTNPEDLTRAEIEGMGQVRHIFQFMKKYAPGFENAVFMGTASTIGLRETRHIDGKAVLTKEDVVNCRVPDDTVAVFATAMDMHNQGDESGSYHILENGPFYGVSYACMIPLKTENLLVAGRSISADATGASTIRMIPCCIALGQAAGVAAAMASAQKKTPATIDPQELREKLRQQGAYLGD